LKINKLKLFGALVAGAVLALTACGGSVPEPEHTLEERVLARWDYRIQRDFESAWEYYSPGFRQTNPREEFVRDSARRPVRWHSVELEWIECENEKLCQVRVEVVFQALGAPSGMSRMRVPQRLTETWIRIDGEWWFSPN